MTFVSKKCGCPPWRCLQQEDKTCRLKGKAPTAKADAAVYDHSGGASDARTKAYAALRGALTLFEEALVAHHAAPDEVPRLQALQDAREEYMVALDGYYEKHGAGSGAGPLNEAMNAVLGRSAGIDGDHETTLSLLRRTTLAFRAFVTGANRTRGGLRTPDVLMDAEAALRRIGKFDESD